MYFDSLDSDSVLYIYAVRYMKTSLYVQDNLFLKAKLNQMILLHSGKVLTAARSERIIKIVMVTSSWHVSCLAPSFPYQHGLKQWHTVSHGGCQG